MELINQINEKVNGIIWEIYMVFVAVLFDKHSAHRNLGSLYPLSALIGAFSLPRSRSLHSLNLQVFAEKYYGRNQPSL